MAIAVRDVIARAGLNPLRCLVLVGQPSIRRQLVDELRQVLAQGRQYLIARHPGLARNRVEIFVPDRLREIVGRDRLVRAVAYPGLRRVAVAVLLHVADEVAQAAAQNAARSPAGEESAEHATQSTPTLLRLR